MDRELVVQQIISDLAKYRPHNEIITELCEQHHLGWGEATTLVKEVERSAKREIDRKRRPIYIGIGAIIMFAGCAMVGGVGFATLDGWIIIPLRLPIPYLGNITLILLGIGLLVGGAMGTLDAMKDRD